MNRVREGVELRQWSTVEAQTIAQPEATSPWKFEKNGRWGRPAGSTMEGPDGDHMDRDCNCSKFVIFV